MRSVGHGLVLNTGFVPVSTDLSRSRHVCIRAGYAGSDADFSLLNQLHNDASCGTGGIEPAVIHPSDLASGDTS